MTLSDTEVKIEETNSRSQWVDDSAVTSCQYCGQSFSLFCRRHHCRQCGKIFCKECTTMRIRIPGKYANENVRVCDGCGLLLVHEASTSLSDEINARDRINSSLKKALHEKSLLLENCSSLLLLIESNKQKAQQLLCMNVQDNCAKLEENDNNINNVMHINDHEGEDKCDNDSDIDDKPKSVDDVYEFSVNFILKCESIFRKLLLTLDKYQLENQRLQSIIDTLAADKTSKEEMTLTLKTTLLNSQQLSEKLTEAEKEKQSLEVKIKDLEQRLLALELSNERLRQRSLEYISLNHGQKYNSNSLDNSLLKPLMHVVSEGNQFDTFNSRENSTNQSFIKKVSRILYRYCCFCLYFGDNDIHSN